MKKENEIVVKDNKIIRTKVNVNSVDEGRLLAYYISIYRTDDKELKEDYKAEIKKIINDYSGRSYAKFREFCRNFLRCSVEIESKNEKGENVFIAFPFFTMVRYENGIVTISFNQKLKHFILDLKEKFTKYSLEEYKKLSTIYSQRLFEILKSYSNLSEIEIEIQELHRMLNTPKSHSKDYFRFRTKVLDNAHKEIISKTNFYFDYEPIKGGSGGRTSPVIAIKFVFTKKKIAPVKEKKTLEQKEKEKIKQKKKSQEINKNFTIAFQCAKSCKGDCSSLANKPDATICELCKKGSMCEEVKRKQQKKTTYKSGGVDIEQADFLEYINKNK